MADPLYLQGEIQTHNAAEAEIERLRGLSMSLQNQLHDCRAQFAQMKLERDAMVQAVSGLRKLLAPLWGEVQGMSELEMFNESPAPKGDSHIWDEWKQKLGKACGNIIDALQKHGALDANQINIITKCGRGNVSTYMSRLNKANLIDKNGDKYSLKEI